MDCSLVQVTHTVPPEVLFGRQYPYYSSFIPSLLAHSRTHAETLLRERRLGPKSLVIEVASNDGYLLKNFVAAGVPVLGIDPAEGPVAAAIAQGVPTRHDFFRAELARDLAGSGVKADVIIANNVAAHVDTINDFISGFAILLKDNGIAIFEFAYLRDLIEKCEFDTVYHEHLFYHSLTALKPLFERHGLYMNDAERLHIHGGSLRVRVSKVRQTSLRLKTLMREEAALGMGALAYYTSFSKRVSEHRARFVDMMSRFRKRGARIAAYGAAAKGATLLNYASMEPETIEYVVDRNRHKTGKYMPGVKLPIRPVESLTEDFPDYVLILAWNFGGEIMDQNRDYARMGGKFILPLPELRVV